MDSDNGKENNTRRVPPVGPKLHKKPQAKKNDEDILSKSASSMEEGNLHHKRGREEIKKEDGKVVKVTTSYGGKFTARKYVDKEQNKLPEKSKASIDVEEDSNKLELSSKNDSVKSVKDVKTLKNIRKQIDEVIEEGIKAHDPPKKEKKKERLKDDQGNELFLDLADEEGSEDSNILKEVIDQVNHNLDRKEDEKIIDPPNSQKAPATLNITREKEQYNMNRNVKTEVDPRESRIQYINGRKTMKLKSISKKAIKKLKKGLPSPIKRGFFKAEDEELWQKIWDTLNEEEQEMLEKEFQQNPGSAFEDPRTILKELKELHQQFDVNTADDKQMEEEVDAAPNEEEKKEPVAKVKKDKEKPKSFPEKNMKEMMVKMQKLIKDCSNRFYFDYPKFTDMKSTFKNFCARGVIAPWDEFQHFVNEVDQLISNEKEEAKNPMNFFWMSITVMKSLVEFSSSVEKFMNMTQKGFEALSITHKDLVIMNKKPTKQKLAKSQVVKNFNMKEWQEKRERQKAENMEKYKNEGTWIEEEEWKKLSIGQQILKRFIFAVDHQNLLPSQWKQLSDDEKNQFDLNREKWRDEFEIKLEEMKKDRMKDATKLFGEYKFFMNRVKIKDKVVVVGRKRRIFGDKSMQCISVRKFNIKDARMNCEDDDQHKFPDRKPKIPSRGRKKTSYKKKRPGNFRKNVEKKKAQK